MILELSAITVGLIISYFLKDFQFLLLDLDFFNTGLIYPDFLLMFVIFFSLYRYEFVGLWIGFLGGLLEDSTNWVFESTAGGFTAVIGVHAFVYSLVGFSIGKLSHYFDNYQASFTIVVALVVAILSRFFIWFIYGIIDTFNMNYPIVGPAIYTALLCPLWFSLLNWVYRFSK